MHAASSLCLPNSQFTSADVFAMVTITMLLLMNVWETYDALVRPLEPVDAHCFQGIGWESEATGHRYGLLGRV